MPSHTVAPWKPVLDNDLATGAWRAIAAIERDLQHQDLSAMAPTISGHSGEALLYAYLARATGEARYIDLAERSHALALDGAETRVLPATLFDGFVGIAW